MKNKATPLVDEYLQSLQGLQATGTDDFFYTRLRARMDKRISNQSWALPFKPALLIGTLSILLILNGLILASQFNNKKTNSAEKSSIQKFAESYDLVASSY